MNRRDFLTKSITAGTAVTLATTAHAASGSNERIKIIGVSCSPRKGMTTATSVKAALNAAAGSNSSVETELIDLGGMDIRGWGAPTETQSDGKTDFQAKVEPLLRSPNLAGLIIGSPVYFRAMSALCKAFLEQLAVMRTPKLLLSNITIGALAVGGYRNGGQELVVNQIQTAMLSHESVIVGGNAPAFQGATLWNAYNDDITKDELGITSAKKLGISVADAAVALKDK